MNTTATTKNYEDKIELFKSISLANADGKHQFRTLATKDMGNTQMLLGAFASNISSNTRLGERYGLTSQQIIKIPSPHEFHKNVALARDIYFREGIVRTAIDKMVDFACVGFENKAKSSRVKSFFDMHCKYADMDNIIRKIVWEYLVSGDVFLYRGDKTIVGNSIDTGKAFYPYTVLNPQKTQVVGSLLFDSEALAIDLKSDLDKLKELPKAMQEKFLANIPSQFKKLFSPNGEIDKSVLTKTGKFILPIESTSRISRNRQDYDRYGTPFLAGIFEPILIKRRLREMDHATAEGMINTIVLFKLGNDEFPAEPVELAVMQNLLETSSKAFELVWTHTLEVEFLNPGWEALAPSKYEEVDQDIKNGLGMPQILISGEGDATASWVGVTGFTIQLERINHEIKRWMEEEYRIIANENGFKESPKVRFNKIDLRDDKAFKNVVLQLRNGGLLDNQTALEDAGYDYDDVLQRKKDQEKDAKYFQPPMLPFSGNPAGKVTTPTNRQGGGGRPPGEVSPPSPEQDNVKTPKGKEGDIGGK
ncbi:MAG: hypothetical protein WC476_01085 [Phycisphaerae bacterium]|jgi:hypothetical protein